MSCQTVRVKGGLLPFTILELQNLDYPVFETELQGIITQMPGFFNGAPVVISLDKITNLNGFNAQCLFDVCQQQNLKPVAFRGTDEQQSLIEAQGYTFLSQSQSKKVATDDTGSEKRNPDVSQSEVKPNIAPEELTSRPGKIISQPVRSGQQIYAPGGDLIILSNVSEAAEVMADGHIHIYGALRGRALAGVNGDLSARIFCHKLEAQLISIAGYFKLAEDFQDKAWGCSMQARLNDQTLLIEPLSS